MQEMIALGDSLHRSSNDPAAIVQYQKALNYAKRLDSIYWVGWCYSKLALSYCYDYQFELAREYADKALKISEAIEPTEVELKASAITIIGSIYLNLGDLNEALSYYQEALALRKLNTNEPVRVLGRSYMDLGSTYDDMNKVEEALQYYDSALSVLAPAESKNPGLLSDLYQLLAIGYKKKNKFNKALIFYGLAEELEAKYRATGTEYRLSKIYINRANVYNMQLKRRAAIGSYRQSMEVMENAGQRSSTRMILAFSNLGVTYSEIGKHDSALYYYDRASEVALQVLGSSHYYISEIQKNIAISAAELGNFQLAQKNAEDALVTMKSFYGDQHTRLSTTYNTLGFVSKRKKDYKSALKYYELSMDILQQNGIYHEGDTVAAEMSLFYDYINLALNGKAEAMYGLYQQNGNVDHLKQSHRLFLISDKVTTDNRLSSYHFEDIISMTARSQQVYNGLIEVLLSMSAETSDHRFKRQAFYYSEKNRDVAIKSSFSKVNLLHTIELPKTLQNLELQMKQEISILKSSLRLTSDSTQLDSLRTEMSGALSSYDSLLSSIKQRYPRYHQRKHEESVFSIDSIQARLSDTTSVLAYFVNKNQVHRFVITKSQFQTSSSMVSNLPDRVDEFRNAIINQDIDAYTRLGQQLYQDLIAPVADQLVGSELIIIPDDILWHLNFDLLLQRPPGNRNPAKFP
ncbi:MAG: tetratricopeptide repeat protein, partial [Bacteroidota bacterium]